jgi:hypothetical protein
MTIQVLEFLHHILNNNSIGKISKLLIDIWCLFSHKNNIEYRVNEHSRSLIHHVVFNYLRYLLWIMNFLYFPKSYPTPAIFFKQSYFLSRFYHQKMFCQINGMTDYFVKIKALIHTPNKFNQRGCFRGLFLSQYMPFDM